METNTSGSNFQIKDGKSFLSVFQVDASDTQIIVPVSAHNVQEIPSCDVMILVQVAHHHESGGISSQLDHMNDNIGRPKKNDEKGIDGVYCTISCDHDYRLNEEIGIYCTRCSFVNIEIKDITLHFEAGMHEAEYQYVPQQARMIRMM
uniref:Uncharacterized protein n=1 Tax=Medicago truncatula TaxID=3880 RepID=Q1RU97_MEDTR|nr:hypothetical protein MtrDRAFT_AC153123g27v2 [Medicago truncatula]